MLSFPKWKIFLIISVCLVSFFLAIINILPKNSKTSSILPGQRINLGLDLRGGSQLMLEIDFDTYLKERMENLRDDLKQEFKKELVRTIPSVTNKKIIFTVSSDEELEKAKKIIRKNYPDIDINEKDKRVEISFTNQQIVKIQHDLMIQSIEIVRRRVDESGTKEPTIQANGNNRILLQVPGLDNPEQIKSLLGQTAKMTFHFVDVDSTSDDREIARMFDKKGNSYPINKQVILSGDLLVDANTTYHQGEPAVSFRFNNVGSKKFAEITENNIGRIFAIILDDKVVTAPRINSVINQGMGVISGSFTVQEAHDVAILLRAGALPAPLKIVEERTVGPSLGLDSIKSGFYASIAGLILVAIAMLLFYRFFGIIANIALLVNIAMVLSALALINATLTLPGIAGIVLTMGMAVDANVLIFERIKEELRSNKNVIAAIDSGFSQAFRTIVDSNITTLIAAILLYIFGDGPVRGFAVTLSFGILASMFSAITLTRLIISSWLKKKRPQSISHLI